MQFVTGGFNIVQCNRGFSDFKITRNALCWIYAGCIGKQKKQHYYM